jgi:hypothetical protein
MAFFIYERFTGQFQALIQVSNEGRNKRERKKKKKKKKRGRRRN